jgi:hypothetical protein
MSGRCTVGADKGYDTKRFVAELRNRGSAIDGRTTRYAEVVRRRIEQTFGWMKVFGGLGRLSILASGFERIRYMVASRRSAARRGRRSAARAAR